MRYALMLSTIREKAMPLPLILSAGHFALRLALGPRPLARMGLGLAAFAASAVINRRAS